MCKETIVALELELEKFVVICLEGRSGVGGY
jgi:hypothetical protein